MPIEEQKELGRQIEPIFDKTLSYLLKPPTKEKDKVDSALTFVDQ